MKCLLASLSASLVLLGCNPKQGAGPLISTYTEFKPDAMALQQAILNTAGLAIPVGIKKTEAGNEVTIELTAKGQTFETERYRSTPEGFALVEAALERYEPALALVRFPMRVGDGWDWKGKVLTGPQGHEATAKVKTSAATLVINGATNHEVVEVDVILSFDSGVPNQPVVRKLQFWLAKDMGVVKRKFGDYSSREPVGGG